jgi:uncharacterized protein (TIGR00255 family)
LRLFNSFICSELTKFMPVYSMTGYASVQASDANPSGNAAPRLGLEIRSVNSRFLDLNFRLSDELRHCESALRELLIAHLKRGKVELRAFVGASADQTGQAPSVALLQRLNQAQDSVLAWLPTARPLSVADVMRLAANDHGSEHSKSSRSSDADYTSQIVALCQQAIADLLASREREGARLAQMLLGHTAQLRALAQAADPLIPELVAQQKQKFIDRFMLALNASSTHEAGSHPITPQAAQDRALTEATAFAIRIDVAEEITRLGAHLDEIDRLLTTQTAPAIKVTPSAKPEGRQVEIGKRLDFVIQELHREANTLGSKSPVIELTRISVDMKVLIEQMREQVQNIE